MLSRMRIATVTGIAERLQCCNHGHDMDVVMFFIKTALVRIMLAVVKVAVALLECSPSW